MLRLLPGEALDQPSRELDVAAHRLALISQLLDDSPFTGGSSGR